MSTHQNQPFLQNLSTQSVHFLSETMIVGRHQDCNLVLKSEKGASRKHARITVQNESVVLMDLGSLNGTLVNGREINRAVQLSDGDIVVFDEQEYRFTGSTSQPQSGSDNVTVIVNKDEVGRPDRIKPAIRLVETTPVPPNNNNSVAALDNTMSWESDNPDLDDTQSAEDRPDTGQRNNSSDHSSYDAQSVNSVHQQPDQPPFQPQPQAAQAQESSTLESKTHDAQPQAIPSPESQAHASHLHGAHPQTSQAQDPHHYRELPSQTNRVSTISQTVQEPQDGEENSQTVEINADVQPQSSSFDHHNGQQTDQHHDAPAGGSPLVQDSNYTARDSDGYYDDLNDFPSIRTSPRPGGGSFNSPPGLEKHYGYSRNYEKKTNWKLWLIIIPLAAVLVAGGLYLAYNAGMSAGSTHSSDGFS